MSFNDKTGNIRVSVVVPVYNRCEYLTDALESLKNQTFKDFEVIVTDDNSSIEYAAINKKTVEAFDERFKYVFLPQNKGPGAARNAGFKLAQGEYITILDSDDKYHPQKLETGVNFLDKNPEYGMCVHFFRYIPATKDNLMLCRPFKNMSENMIDFLFFKPRFYHWCMMIRKSALTQYNLYYDEDRVHEIGEDSKFLYECLKTLKTAYIDRVLYYYRRHKENISLNNPKALIDGRFKQSCMIRFGLILDDLKMNYTQADLETHWQFCRCEAPKNFDDIDKWLFNLAEHNKQVNFFPQKTFEMILANHYFELCLNTSKKYAVWSLWMFLKSPWAFRAEKNILRWGVFGIKVLAGTIRTGSGLK